MLKRVRHCFILAFTAGLGLLLQAAESPANTLTDDEKKAGWVLLFDGKSLDHWRDPRKLDPPSDSWALEDGSIKALAHPRINEDLFSADTYRDFEFQWDWRISQGGNSGSSTGFSGLSGSPANTRQFRASRTKWSGFSTTP